MDLEQNLFYIFADRNIAVVGSREYEISEHRIHNHKTSLQLSIRLQYKNMQ